MKGREDQVFTDSYRASHVSWHFELHKHLKQLEVTKHWHVTSFTCLLS